MSNHKDSKDKEVHYETQSKTENKKPSSVILLPVKRNAGFEKDIDLSDFYKFIRKESAIEKKRKILGIESQSKKTTFPLYGLTSPVPYPSRYAYQNQKPNLN